MFASLYYTICSNRKWGKISVFIVREWTQDSSVKGNRRSVQLLLNHKDLSGTKNIAMVILSGMALNCTVMKF